MPNSSAIRCLSVCSVEIPSALTADRQFPIGIGFGGKMPLNLTGRFARRRGHSSTDSGARDLVFRCAKMFLKTASSGPPVFDVFASFDFARDMSLGNRIRGERESSTHPWCAHELSAGADLIARPHDRMQLDRGPMNGKNSENRDSIAPAGAAIVCKVGSSNLITHDPGPRLALLKAMTTRTHASREVDTLNRNPLDHERAAAELWKRKTRGRKVISINV